jgi:hypothetical protein
MRSHRLLEEVVVVSGTLEASTSAASDSDRSKRWPSTNWVETLSNVLGSATQNLRMETGRGAVIISSRTSAPSSMDQEPRLSIPALQKLRGLSSDSDPPPPHRAQTFSISARMNLVGALASHE